MPKQITEKRLYNITLFYLSKYEASAEKVKQMLKRRLDKATLAGAEIPAESDIWINNVIAKMESLGYINDERFAENQVRILTRQGKSAKFITGKLLQAGISAEVIRALLDETEQSDTERALTWLKHRRRGPYRTNPPQTPEELRLIRQKDLAALARAGFSYQTATEALQHEEPFS